MFDTSTWSGPSLPSFLKGEECEVKRDRIVKEAEEKKKKALEEYNQCVSKRTPTSSGASSGSFLSMFGLGGTQQPPKVGGRKKTQSKQKKQKKSKKTNKKRTVSWMY